MRRRSQPRGDAAAVSRTLHTAAISEDAVAERLAGVAAELAPAPDLSLTYLSAPGRVRIRLTGKAATREAALARLRPVEERVREILGDTVYGSDDESLEGVLHFLLEQRRQTVAAAESLTGGLVAQRLTATPGASRTFRGGVTAYATDVKASVLGVPTPLLDERGAVDPQVAAAMAAGARDLLGATYGLGLTGVAGPDPQDGQDPGTVHVALAGSRGDGVIASARLRGDRRSNREHAAVLAFDLLRRRLCGLQPALGREVSAGLWCCNQ